MQIVIVGAGVSGLSSYLLLKKHLLSSDVGHEISISIYDAYNIHRLTTTTKPLYEPDKGEPVFTPVAIGSAIGVSQNGLQVVRRLDSDSLIVDNVKRRGNPVTTWRMSNARGWTLANASLVPESQKATGSSRNPPPRPQDMTVMIARQDLWEVLRDEVLRSGAIVMNKKVKHIAIGKAKSKSIISFEDGSTEEADLVIGADGLRSSLRRAMFDVETAQSSSPQTQSGILSQLYSFFGSSKPEATDFVTPHYEGLAGLGGFIPTKELQRNNNFDPKQMNIVFGPNGFFGYGCISSIPSSTLDSSTDATGTVSAWWSTWASPIPYPYRSETDSSNNKKLSSFDHTTALKDLLSRHRSWKNPDIQRILDHVSETGLKANDFYPTWTTPELPHWQKNGTAVLIGDAAHALQPSSGQGASQALEDAEALALLLKHYLTLSNTRKNAGETETETGRKGTIMDMDEAEAMATALRKYEQLRMPRVHDIYVRSQKMGKAKGDMGFVMEMVVYFFVWAMSLFHDKYMDTLHNYDLPAEVDKIVAMD